MVTITLPPELEQIVTEQARQQGTTPDLLAIDSLTKLYLPPAALPEPDGTKDLRPIAEMLAEIAADIPAEEAAKVPADFTDTMNDVRIYKRALSAAEVADLAGVKTVALPRGSNSANR